MTSREQLIQIVSRDLLSVPPLVFRAVRRRITRTALSDDDLDITPNQFEILSLLKDRGEMHVSEIGETLQIGKAQMTQVIDRLVCMGMIKRVADDSDRRTYNISITPQAGRVVEEHRKKVAEAVEEIMSGLSDAELENLSASLRTIRDTLLRSTSDLSR